MTAIHRLRIVALAAVYLGTGMGSRGRAALRTAYKRAYFRTVCEAYVHSGDVSTSAKIGRRVYAGKCVTVFPSVEIGDFTTINSSSWIESGTLGKFCSVAANVSIGMEEHPLHHVSTHVATYDSPLFGLISKPKDRLHSKPAPQIGNDVWLARGAIVLRGVNIGDGATVGAGAVVTKDVEPYAIVAGAPARVVRYRFSNAEIASLRALEWWNDPEFYEREFERRPIGIQHFDLPHRDS